MRITLLFLVSVALSGGICGGFAQSSPRSQSTTISDSLGLEVVNRSLGLLPAGALTNRLAFGDLKRLRPNRDMTGVGISSASWEVRDRPDSIRVDYEFRPDSGEWPDWHITDNARTSRISVYWTGTSLAAFRQKAAPLLLALRATSVAPSCLKHAPDLTREHTIRRVQTAAWYADNWTANIFVSANRLRGETQFHVSYNAEANDSLMRDTYKPIRQSRRCLPRLTEVIAPFLVDSSAR